MKIDPQSLNTACEPIAMDTLFSALLPSPWKAYCISLPRCTERRETFSKWAHENGLTFTFWDAFDKREMGPETFTSKRVLVGQVYCKGATACRISHESLWTHILTNEPTLQSIVIFEDDAGFGSNKLDDLRVFLEGSKKIPNWAILQLGFGTMTGSELSLLSNRYPPKVYQTNFCDQTHAMIYKRDALLKMNELAKNPQFQTRPSDGLLLAFIHKKQGIVLAPERSILVQTDSISYISKD